MSNHYKIKYCGAAETSQPTNCILQTKEQMFGTDPRKKKIPLFFFNENENKIQK